MYFDNLAVVDFNLKLIINKVSISGSAPAFYKFIETRNCCSIHYIDSLQ